MNRKLYFYWIIINNNDELHYLFYISQQDLVPWFEHTYKIIMRIPDQMKMLQIKTLSR